MNEKQKFSLDMYKLSKCTCCAGLIICKFIRIFVILVCASIHKSKYLPKDMFRETVSRGIHLNICMGI